MKPQSQKRQPDERKRLIDEIKDISEEIELLKNNYHYVTEEMIDYYTYQIKAAETKYRYLLKKLRKYDAV